MAEWDIDSSHAPRRQLTITRALITGSNDQRRMQEVDYSGLRNQEYRGAERVQNYGFSSVPVGPDGSGSTARGAEAIVLGNTGSASHPIVIGVDDRRHRPRGQQAGDVSMYDNRQQRFDMTSTGIKIAVPEAKKITITVGENTKIELTKDKIKAQVEATGPAFVLKKGKCAQIKKLGTPALHFTIDIENNVIKQGSASIIVPDPFPGE